MKFYKKDKDGKEGRARGRIFSDRDVTHRGFEWEYSYRPFT